MIHAGDREGLDQVVLEHGLLRPKHLPQRMLDLADEYDLARRGSGEPPELAEEAVIRSLGIGAAKGLGDVVAFRFLHIEANVIDALRDIEIEQLAWSVHTFGREHCDYVEGYAMLAEQANASDSLVEGAVARSGHAIAVMEPLGPVDADANADSRRL